MKISPLYERFIVVTDESKPIAETVSHVKKLSISKFENLSDEPWKKYRRKGYKCLKVDILFKNDY